MYTSSKEVVNERTQLKNNKDLFSMYILSKSGLKMLSDQVLKYRYCGHYKHFSMITTRWEKSPKKQHVRVYF